MDPLTQVPRPQNCNRHNQPILLYDSDPNKGAFCLVCMQEKTGMISAESYQQKLKTIIEQEIELYKSNFQLFQDWHNKIQIYKESLILTLDKIHQVIDDQMRIIQINTEKFLQLSQQSIDYQKTIADVQLKIQNSQKENEQAKFQVIQNLLGFCKNYLKSVKELLNQFCQQPRVSSKVAQIDEKKFEYELIKQSWKKEGCGWYYAFAFNKESNILVAAYYSQIIVYQLNKGTILKVIQRLTDHTDIVYCLYFMKQTNSFVSGSADNSIIIWDFDKVKNQWYALSILKGHTHNVYCLQMNKCEDVLISGSVDNTIKFWNKINSSWSIQQTVTANNGVKEIGLNEAENKLISCICLQIQILEKGSDKIWRIVQTINSDGLRLCLTVGEQFVFTPYSFNRMEVYDYNKGEKQFEKIQEISIQKLFTGCNLFPCRYIQKLNIVVVAQSQYINIFKINSVGNYQLIQTINFEYASEIHGGLSDDGEYLVTWDLGSEQIQVRSLKFIK